MASTPIHIHHGDGLTAEQLAEIEHAVDTWPPLTPAQRDTLAALFTPEVKGAAPTTTEAAPATKTAPGSESTSILRPVAPGRRS